MAFTDEQAAQIAAMWSPNLPAPMWLSYKSYGVGICVIHSGSIWIAVAPNQGSEPPSADWVEVVTGGGGGGGVGPGTVGTVPVFSAPNAVGDSTASTGAVLLGTADQPVGNSGSITIKTGDAPDGDGGAGSITIQPGVGGDGNGAVRLLGADSLNSLVVGDIVQVAGPAPFNVASVGGLLVATTISSDGSTITTDGSGALTAVSLHAPTASNSGTFTTSDAKTVTVVDGIITSIV